MPESTHNTTTVSTGKSRQGKAPVKDSPDAAGSSSSSFYDASAPDDTQETEDAQEMNGERERGRKRQFRWNPNRYISLLRVIILRAPYAACLSRRLRRGG
jgi:hypothetical protein